MADNTDAQDYQDYLDYQEYQKYQGSSNASSSGGLFNDAAGISNALVSGAVDMASFANELNPLQPGGPRLWGLNENILNSQNLTGNEIKSGLKDLYILGDEKAKTPIGKIGEGVAYFLPGAIGGSAVPAVAGGLASGVAKAADVGEGGQALAGLVGGVTPSAGKALFSGTIGKIPGLFSAKNAARAELQTALKGVEVPITEGGSTLDTLQTLAESTQSPAVARLEQEVTKRTGTANDALQALNRERKDQALKVIQDISSDGERTAEAGGHALRGIIKPEQQIYKKDYESIFESLSNLTEKKNTKIKVDGIYARFFKDLESTYEAGGMPGDIKSIASEVSAANKVVPAQSSSGILDRFGKVISESNGQAAGDKPFSWVHALRQRANKAWSDAKRLGDKDAARVANNLVKTIDSELENQLTGQALTTFKDARKSYSDYMSTFESKDVGRAIREHATGDYILNSKQAINAVFDGSPETARQLIKSIGKNKESRNVLAGVLRDKIIRETTKDGVISPGKFRSWLKANKEMLTAEHDGMALITKEQVENFENLSRNLEFLDPQSARSVRSLAYQASSGQPTTAQAIIQEEASKGILSKVPGLGAYQRYRRGVIDGILSDVLLNPSRASLLLEPATAQSVNAANQVYGPLFSSVLKGISQKDTLATEKKEPLNKGGGNAEPIRPVSLFSPGKADFFLDDMKPQVVSDITLDALRQVESGGGKYLKSKAGALGEYQFMPATAREYGIDPMNPTEARAAARKYLESSLATFGGNLKLALASYNAGVGRVKSAMRKAQSTDWEDVSKFLPEETRLYVPKIESWIKTFEKRRNDPIEI